MNISKNKYIRNLGYKYYRKKTLFTLVKCYYYDLVRYYKYSNTYVITKNNEQLISDILRIAHGFEKGLALPEPRLFFGKEKYPVLINRLIDYKERGLSLDDAAYQKGVSALQSYYMFHQTHGIESKPEFAYLKSFLEKCPTYLNCGGIKKIYKSNLTEKESLKNKIFLQSRHSTREFSTTPVSDELLRESIEIAQCAPSACNRQPGRVYYINSHSKIIEIITLQGGARGFESNIPGLLIVTSSVSGFSGQSERNQAYIDGGIFFMNLLMGLQVNGFVSCSLNWSASPEKDKMLRKIVKINKSEIIICLLAIGNSLPEYKVAISKRRNTDKIFYHLEY